MSEVAQKLIGPKFFDRQVFGYTNFRLGEISMFNS